MMSSMRSYRPTNKRECAELYKEFVEKISMDGADPGPIYFEEECLPEMILYGLYAAFMEWEKSGKVPWLYRLKSLMRMIEKKDREQIAANIYRLNRKFYDLVKEECGISVDLRNIHR